MGTVAGSWLVVRGSWSVSVEFCFYFLFPFLVVLLTGFGRVLTLIGLAALIAWFAPILGMSMYASRFEGEAVNLFLFYWFPNQLIVFPLGFLLYMLMARIEGEVGERMLAGIRALSLPLIMMTGCMFIGLAYLPHYKYFIAGGGVPTHMLAALVFMLLAAALMCAPRAPPLLVNRLICRLGEVSFSAYLVHWAVLDVISHQAWLPLAVTGWPAVAAFPIGLGVAVALSGVIARFTYLYIESPAIRYGRKIEKRLSSN